MNSAFVTLNKCSINASTYNTKVIYSTETSLSEVVQVMYTFNGYVWIVCFTCIVITKFIQCFILLSLIFKQSFFRYITGRFRFISGNVFNSLIAFTNNLRCSFKYVFYFTDSRDKFTSKISKRDQESHRQIFVNVFLSFDVWCIASKSSPTIRDKIPSCRPVLFKLSS